MSNILFRKGSYNEFKTKVLGYDTETQQFSKPKFIDEGALYFTEDEGGLYLGVSVPNVGSEGTHLDVKRIQGSLLYFDTLEAFENEVAPPYDTNVIYFIGDKNTLARYDGSEWKILNSNQDVVASLTAEINSIRGDLSAETGRATAKEEELAGLIIALEDRVVVVEGFSTRLDTLEDALDDKAKQSDLASLIKRVEATEDICKEAPGAIQNLQNNKLSINGSIAMTGNLKMGEDSGTHYKIINLNDGTANSDAATVGQVKAVEAAATGAVGAVAAELSSLKETELAWIIDFDNSKLKLTEDLDAGQKKITNIATPSGTDDTQVANVSYVKGLVKANDAMTFCGTVGQIVDGEMVALPLTSAQQGDTYKVAGNGTFTWYTQKPEFDDEGNVVTPGVKTTQTARVGDLFINKNVDDDYPIWEHISSGYSDQFTQDFYGKNSKVYLTNGVNLDESFATGSLSVVGAEDSNLSFVLTADSVMSNDCTFEASMVWGTF